MLDALDELELDRQPRAGLDHVGRFPSLPRFDGAWTTSGRGLSDGGCGSNRAQVDPGGTTCAPRAPSGSRRRSRRSRRPRACRTRARAGLAADVRAEVVEDDFLPRRRAGSGTGATSAPASARSRSGRRRSAGAAARTPRPASSLRRGRAPCRSSDQSASGWSRLRLKTTSRASTPLRRSAWTFAHGIPATLTGQCVTRRLTRRALPQPAPRPVVELDMRAVVGVPRARPRRLGRGRDGLRPRAGHAPCGTSVWGELGSSWLPSSVVAGPLVLFRGRSHASSRGRRSPASAAAATAARSCSSSSAPAGPPASRSPRRSAQTVALQYDRSEDLDRTVVPALGVHDATFDACPPGRPSLGPRAERWTQFNGGLFVAGRRCVTLEVRAAQARPRPSRRGEARPPLVRRRELLRLSGASGLRAGASIVSIATSFFDPPRIASALSGGGSQIGLLLRVLVVVAHAHRTRLRRRRFPVSRRRARRSRRRRPTRAGRSSAAPSGPGGRGRSAPSSSSEISPSACLTPRYGMFRSSW